MTRAEASATRAAAQQPGPTPSTRTWGAITMTETFRPGTVCPSRRHDDLDRRPDAGRGIVVCAACRDQADEALIEMPEWYEICAHVLDLRRPPQLRERVNGHRPRGIV